MSRRLAAAAALAVLGLQGAACVPAGPIVIPQATLDGTDGARHALRDPTATATVLVFFSQHCPCMRAHDGRLTALAQAYGPRGVRVLSIDSEVDATPARDLEEARQRGYPFPILIDPHGKVASALDAEYATYTVILDADGNVRYHGAFDDQRKHLQPGETSYVRDALDDLLAKRPVRRTTASTLGCSLRTW